MATDPVCGMYVDEKSSKLVWEREGRRYYFCSSSCKIQFEKPEKELRDIRISLFVAWPLTAIVILLSYLLRLSYGGYLMFVLASVVQFYSGKRFYAGIVDAIRNRSSNMDTLIAIGTSAAWAYSTIVVFFPSAFPSNGVYFDTSTIIISLILTGTYMQRLAETKASGAISALIKLQPKVAHVVSGRTVTDVPVAEVRKGDLILVPPITASPGFFDTGTLSPVIIDSSMELYPLTTTGQATWIR